MENREINELVEAAINERMGESFIKKEREIGILYGMLNVYEMLSEYSDGDAMAVDWRADNEIIIRVSQHESVGSGHPNDSVNCPSYDAAYAFVQGLIIAAVHARMRTVWTNHYKIFG